MELSYVQHMKSRGLQGVDIISTQLKVDAEIVRHSLAVLSDAERRRASQFVFDRDRHRFIIARANLRFLLAERLNTKPQSVELSYGARGKPAIAPSFSSSDLRFNLSHSGDIAVYAFATEMDVGIDVERIRPITDAESIAARFFSPSENEAYLSLESRCRSIGFFNCWTRKEAFIKALGEGLFFSLDRFDVSLEPDKPARILRIDDTPGDECGWHMQSFRPAPGFVAAVVANSGRHGRPGIAPLRRTKDAPTVRSAAPSMR